MSDHSQKLLIHIARIIASARGGRNADFNPKTELLRRADILVRSNTRTLHGFEKPSNHAPLPLAADKNVRAPAPGLKLLACLPAFVSLMRRMFDLLIKNATLYDGTGKPGFEADVAIAGGKIAEVVARGNNAGGFETEARTIIDATGRILTPGFVDVHSHSDFNILVNPQAESKLRQGITTEVVGNCGCSAFPLRRATLADEREENRKLGLELTWSRTAEYFERLGQVKPAVNIATFIGHGTIRGSVLDHEDRQPTPDEMRAMKHEVDEAMDAGALGVSTGLIYPPGIFADTAEIVELQRAAAAKGGIYSSHVRGEGDTLLGAADEFLQVVREANCRGQFSHIKASAPRNWGKVAQVIEQIQQLNDSGGRVRFDKYPYIASSTSLASLLPRWARAGGRDQTLDRLGDASLHERICRESAANNEGQDGWDSILICEAGAPEYEEFQGASLGQIARRRGCSEEEVFVDLLIKGRLLTAICNFTMSQDETDLALLHPLGMVCTDSGLRAPYGPLSHATPHPRAYGTFPKFFRDYVKERPLLKLEDAVAKVTSLPCDTFGFPSRGRVVKGCWADLLVIDWNNFADRATFAAPKQYCSGIDAIIVNGVLTLHHGQQTGNRAGQVLRRT